MSLRTFEYKLPEFISPQGYDRDAFIADALHPDASWDTMRPRHPWLDNMRPSDAQGGVHTHTVAAETTDIGSVFKKIVKNGI